MGVASSHLTRRRLHVSHPARDFLWYRFVGIRPGLEQLPLIALVFEVKKGGHGSLQIRGMVFFSLKDAPVWLRRAAHRELLAPKP